MKLFLSQLQPHLNNTLCSAYLISGEELLLKEDAICLIRKAAKKAGFVERICITPGVNFDWNDLYSLLFSSSLFSEKRLLELDFRDNLPNKVASLVMKEYAENPSNNNLLLINMPKIDARITKSQWYLSLEKIGVSISVWPIPRDQFPRWLRDRAKQYNLMLDQEAIQLLVDHTEGNLIAASQTLEKIYLLGVHSPILAEHVLTVLKDESKYTIFDLTDALIAGKKERSLKILELLKHEGNEPLLIIWGIARELRLMISLLQEKEKGQTDESLFQKYQIFKNRQESIRLFLKRASVVVCYEALTHIAEIDRLFKSTTAFSSWNALQLFCLRMV